MGAKFASLLLILAVSGCGPDTQRHAIRPESGTFLKIDNTPPPSFNERTLDRVSFLSAHNAFANNGDDARFLVPNQEWGITKQLEMGVRGFMLDIWSTKGEAVLCHSTCGFAGTFPWISLVDEFKRFEDFMKKNPEAIITLHLEWTPSARVNEFETALNKFPDLKDMIFDPYKADVKSKGWPRITEMIAQNKRLLILSQTDATRHLGIAFDKEFTVENYWSMGNAAKDRSCRSRWDNIPLDADNSQNHKFRRLFVMNHFRDIPTLKNGALDNNKGSLFGRVENECLNAARRVPNYIALDFVNKGTGRETVDALNRSIGIAFQQGNWLGQTQLMQPGWANIEGGAGKLEDNSLSSIEIFFRGSRVALFDDREEGGFLVDIVETSGSLPDFVNDKTSSWRVDN